MWFIKIKLTEKLDNIGSGPINLPPMEMHTNAAWLSFAKLEGWDEAKISSALNEVAYVMNSFIPLFVHCDKSDVQVVPQVKAAHNEKPTIFVYDTYPGGIGLSEKVYDVILPLLERSLAHVKGCPCEKGCPSCIGPNNSLLSGKNEALKMLQILVNELQ